MLLFTCAALLQVSISFAQEESKDYTMVELSFMNAKMGKADAFEKAVKTHNDKYHPEGRHGSFLDVIATGPNAGTYVWGMGPCMMKDLDDRPGKGAHDDDWQKNVMPLIESYGAVEYWRLDEKLSFIPEGKGQSKVYLIWFLDITRGEYYRFKKLMGDIQKVYAENGKKNIYIWNNRFGTNDGRDVAIEWQMDNYAEMDDDWDLKPAYEKMYGEGSWQLMLEEWEECVSSNSREVWNNVH